VGRRALGPQKDTVSSTCATQQHEQQNNNFAGDELLLRAGYPFVGALAI